MNVHRFSGAGWGGPLPLTRQIFFQTNLSGGTPLRSVPPATLLRRSAAGSHQFQQNSLRRAKNLGVSSTEDTEPAQRSPLFFLCVSSVFPVLLTPRFFARRNEFC